MIYIFKGKQRQYKTTVMVAAALYYTQHGYALSEIYSDIRLYHSDGEELKDYHYLTIPQMRIFVREMVEKGKRHIMLIIDEIDRVFPHRFWNRAGQTEALLGFWQDEKLFIIVLGTMHLGKGMDLLLRESMQVEIFTKHDRLNHVVKLVVVDTLNRRVFKSTMANIELVQKLFNSWDPVI
jgi:hypothetical protein